MSCTRFPPAIARTIAFIAAVLMLAVPVAGCGGSAGDAAQRAKPPAVASELKVATFSSLVRLVPRVDVKGAPTTITLTAARGEREGAQLVAWAPGKGAARIVLAPRALSGPGGASIPAKFVRAYIEQPMRVERGSPAGRSGEYVDPLIPAESRAVTVSRDARLLAWIDVEVPIAATPGTYIGEVALVPATKGGTPRAGEDPVARIPVTLTVRGASIPKLPTLDSSIGFDAGQMVRFEGVRTGTTELRDVTEAYAGALADARLSIADVGAVPPGTLPGHAGLPGDGAYLERVFNRRGVASVRIPFYMTYPFEDPIGRDRPAALVYLRATAKWARAHGWLDRAYVYAIDEPDDALSGDVRELHDLVHEADPGLRLLVTRESSAKVFQGSVDIWVPNVNPRRYRAVDVARERRAGRATWWYPSITSFQPYPTFFIDDLRPSARKLGWDAYRDGVRGVLYWSATHWQEVQDPFHEADTFHDGDIVGNGDGTLLYPGGPIGHPGEAIPSVRLLQLRDGIEDHDLLTMAGGCANPAQERRLRAALLAVAPSISDPGPTDVELAAMRDAALDTIDRAGPAAKCTRQGAVPVGYAAHAELRD